MTEFFTRRSITKAVIALIVLALGVSTPAFAEPGNDNRAPNLGNYTDLQVPAGNKVCFDAYAEGFQVYGWTGSKWTLLRPEAVLYANDNAQGVVGIHYVGPTWESNSGSYVVCAVQKRATVDPASIDWLLLKAVDTDGPGIFDRVTYIQRVHTVGGLAPSAPGNFVGQEVKIPYTADYYFYRQHK